ncbi:MAG: hypothetical protein NTY33_01100 [Candidatus Moranbacteria bacterium]|nr:hypothetical protein [Candidatus Moranbacteria bacterium]
MSEGNKFTVIPGGMPKREQMLSRGEGNGKIIEFPNKEQIEDSLKEEVRNIFSRLENVIVYTDEKKFNLQGLWPILREMEKIGQRISPTRKDGLAERLKYVTCVVANAVEGKEIKYVGKEEQAAAVRQEILGAIVSQMPH